MAVLSIDVVTGGSKTDQIKAEMNNGVLEITVPMAEIKQQSREVP